jgi:hypothetical protein
MSLLPVTLMGRGLFLLQCQVKDLHILQVKDLQFLQVVEGGGSVFLQKFC